MKVIAKTGIKSNKIPKKFTHTTDSSAGCFQVTPVFYKFMLPKGKISCKNGIFYVQANAMSVPTMGNYDFKFHQFFVPYKYVWPAWEDFFTKNIHYYPSSSISSPTVPAIPTANPFITQGDLLGIILNPSYQLCETVNPVADPNVVPDFTVLESDDTVTSYKWTRKGIAAYKLLQNLGYQLSFKAGDKTELCILDLLCFGKVFMDWYFPSNYAFVGVDFYTVQQAFITDLPDVQAASNHNKIYFNAIGIILNSFTYIYFNNSIYYDAWDEPESPNNASSIGEVVFEDVTNTAEYANIYKPHQVVSNKKAGSILSPSPVNGFLPPNGTPFVGGNYANNFSASGVLTEYVLKTLQKLSNFVKRYQLAGSRLIDRWLLYLGESLPDSHRSIKLGDFTCPLQIGEVVATADGSNGSTTTALGEKGGKGALLKKDLSFEFENSQNTHGLYMILMSVVQDNYICSGIDRNKLNLNSLDWVQPLNDALGPKMVYKSEVFCSQDGYKNDDWKGKFGFLPQGYEHAIDRHILSGALVAGSLGADALKAWFPRKYFGSSYQSNIVHSQGFMHANTVDLDAANLPFYDREYSENFIYTCQWHEIELVDSKKALKEVFDFQGEEENQTVEIDNNGSRVN